MLILRHKPEHSDAERLATETAGCRASSLRAARPNPFAANLGSPTRLQQHRVDCALNTSSEELIKNESGPRVTSELSLPKPQEETNT